MVNNQSQGQNMPSALTSAAGGQNSASLVSSTLPSVPNIMSVTQNQVWSSMGKGIPSNVIFVNSQRQMPGGRQQVVAQQQYMMKQKLQQGNMQLQQQHENLLQPAQIQTSQHVVMVGNGRSGGDWQQEVYQKIKAMKEMYFTELNEIYSKIVEKLQQHESQSQQTKNEQLEKLKLFKAMLEGIIQYLRLNKNDIQMDFKDKLSFVEMQIINIVNSHRPRKPVSLQQGQQQPQPHAQSQISQTGLHHNSLSSVPTVSNSQQLKQQMQHQQLKPAPPFSMTSPQVLQVSPQIDQQQNLLSPFVMPPPSTPLAPSPMPESEKVNSDISPGISASLVKKPLLAPSPMPGESKNVNSDISAGISASPVEQPPLAPSPMPESEKVGISAPPIEQPFERLIIAVKSVSPREALIASVSDIISIVSIDDRIAGSSPGNCSRAAVGEDLVPMKMFRMHARNFFTQDGRSTTKRMRISAKLMPSNVVPSSSGSIYESGLTGFFDVR